jgi:hypothetical protein
MKSRLHALAGAVALFCIGIFWASTVVSELFLGQGSVVAVKTGILAAMWLLIPAMAATGASGWAIGKGRGGRLMAAKQRRMKLIAANGLLVLLPSAYALASMASAGRFDGLFYAVQAIELAAGAVNITLLALNMRDGLRLSGRLTR